MSLPWTHHWLVHAALASNQSKDPSTKVGAVAVRGRRLLATGYNGFAAGTQDTTERLTNRPEKLARTVHAEANVVADAAMRGVSLAGASLYTWPLPPCCGCASLLVNAGVRHIVVPRFKWGLPDRWRESVERADGIFAEAGIPVEVVDVPDRIVEWVDFLTAPPSAYEVKQMSPRAIQEANMAIANAGGLGVSLVDGRLEWPGLGKD